MVPKLRDTLFVLVAAFALTACSPDYEAEATLDGNATATMSVASMFGIHSDWHRTFTISDGQSSASLDLPEDTGWWRGSHLYLHGSGTYVVHEGQAGCFGFTVKPASFDFRTPISCAKMRDTAEGLSAGKTESSGYPASRYYVGLFYVGRFVEADHIPELRGRRAETPIVFQSHAQQVEPELPEIL